MERLGGENFVRRNRLNIVASSIAALSVAAAAVAVEKSAPYNPVADSIDSASHLVLKTPHKAYEQLIDNLPEAEKAEAATINCDHPLFVSTYWCASLPVGGDTVNTLDQTSFTVDGAQTINSGCTVMDTSGDHTVVITSYGGILVAGITIGATACCTSNAPQMSGEQVSINATCSGGSSVGGVAESPDFNQLNENLNTKNKDNTLPIAAGVAFGAIGIAGAALYINRRRSS